MKYRKKPLIVDAVQVIPENAAMIAALLGVDMFAKGALIGYQKPEGRYSPSYTSKDGAMSVMIPYEEGTGIVHETEWLIKTPDDGFVSIDNDRFARLYEPVSEDAPQILTYVKTDNPDG